MSTPCFHNAALPYRCVDGAQRRVLVLIPVPAPVGRTSLQLQDWAGDDGGVDHSDCGFGRDLSCDFIAGCIEGSIARGGEPKHRSGGNHQRPGGNIRHRSRINDTYHTIAVTTMGSRRAVEFGASSWL